MKSQLSILISGLALVFAMQVKAAPAGTTKDVVVAVNDVFVPGGFASSADAYVVVSGIFPNSCYKWKGATQTDVTKFEHEVSSVASVSQGMCLMVLVPFSKDIRLGKLDSGSHTLRFVSGDGTFLEKTLVIE